MAKEDSRFEDFPKDQFLKVGSQAQGVQDAQSIQGAQSALNAKDAQGFQDAQDAQSAQKAAGRLWPDEPHGLTNTPSLWGGWCGAGRHLPRTSTAIPGEQGCDKLGISHPSLPRKGGSGRERPGGAEGARRGNQQHESLPFPLDKVRGSTGTNPWAQVVLSWVQGIGTSSRA